MNDAYRAVLGHQMPDIARESFATFSRFEFAMKRGGFHAGEIGKSLCLTATVMRTFSAITCL